MAERETPAELVERVLREGRVPPHRRAALRRELLDHFEDSAASRPVERAIRAFGDAAEVTTTLHAFSSAPIRLGTAVVRSTALVAAWLVTVAVAARLDCLFLDPFQSTQGEMK